MIRAVHSFPRGFLWGTATAAHQVEGDNRNNDWWAWEQEPGHIALGHRSGKACDWWGGRWRDDLDRSAADGHNAHRFSIEWSRVEPTRAVWDEGAIDAYREIAKGALDRGLMPVVTLHHFSNPLWISESGGWVNPEIIPLFERYVRKVVTALQDLVGIWVTINEPNLYAVLAYAMGAFPPGGKDIGKAVRAARNLTLAHAAAYHAIHEIQPGSLVGLAHHYRAFWPARPANPLDRWAARARWRMVNDLIPRALADGRFRSLIWNERLPQAAGTQDYFGLNYYTAETIAFDPSQPGALFSRGFFPEGSDLSPTGFIANEPEGLWEALSWAHSTGLPIFVMENGVEDPTDRLRPRYLAAHIRQVWRAVNFAWPVRGYFFWTLVDNFEWERGWTQRFGLWELVPETQERRKRPSADFFREICKANALSSDTVAAYAPEAFEWLFPPKGRMRPEATTA